jgi:hypothetical protein
MALSVRAECRSQQRAETPVRGAQNSSRRVYNGVAWQASDINTLIVESQN